MMLCDLNYVRQVIKKRKDISKCFAFFLIADSNIILPSYLQLPLQCSPH